MSKPVGRIVQFKVLNEDAVEPLQAHPGDAGYDLCSLETRKIDPGETYTFMTGIAVELPEDVVMLVASRSGLASKRQLHVLNSPGVVDSGYRGEVGVMLHNSSKIPQFIAKGDRIAQALFMPFFGARLVEVDELGASERGEGGFGSTGVGAIEPVAVPLRVSSSYLIEMDCIACKATVDVTVVALECPKCSELIVDAEPSEHDLECPACGLVFEGPNGADA